MTLDLLDQLADQEEGRLHSPGDLLPEFLSHYVATGTAEQALVQTSPSLVESLAFAALTNATASPGYSSPTAVARPPCSSTEECRNLTAAEFADRAYFSAGADERGAWVGGSPVFESTVTGALKNYYSCHKSSVEYILLWWFMMFGWNQQSGA